MNKFIILLCFIFLGSSFGVNEAYLKTKIKNRAAMQQKTNAFEHTKYKYISNQDVKKAQKSKNPNIGVINVDRNQRAKNVQVFIDSNEKIKVKNKANTQIGVINIGKGAKLDSANVYLKAKKGIDVKQTNPKNKTQIGVVNMNKSAKVRDIRTIVESGKKINVK